MEVLDNELQVQAGEDDVVVALRSLNAAQDYFEALSAKEPDILGDTKGTVTTSASTETTTFPTGLLRVDRLQFIDPTTSLPQWDLLPLRRTGSHIDRRFWPYNIFSVQSSPGRPAAYWTDGRNIYWDPLPDATHTVRWYGLQAATDITASGTFAYPDICMLPFASFAARLLSMGLADDSTELMLLAETQFKSIIDALRGFQRDGPGELHYTQTHTT
jgi:hypothetical protein